jgi:hypothetical protein
MGDSGERLCRLMCGSALRFRSGTMNLGSARRIGRSLNKRAVLPESPRLSAHQPA